MKPPVFDPAWSDEVKALYKHDTQEMWDRTLQTHIWNQYHNQLDVYLGFASTAGGRRLRILDVGCAQGTLAILLAEAGHEVIAVDLRPSFLEYAKTRYTHGNIEFIVGNVLEMNLPNDCDLIFANQIIEHLVYPNRLVRQLTRALRAGGRLVVATPNWHYFLNPLPRWADLGDLRAHEHKQFTADADGHFFAFTANELRQVFHEEGHEQVGVRYFESPFISGHVKIRYAHAAIPASLLRVADRTLLALPFAGRAFAHQLLVTGIRKEGRVAAD